MTAGWAGRTTSAAAAVLALACIAGGARAAPDRVHALASELRCPVCQNQTLADSNADLAVDLRREIQRQVDGGRNDDEIRRFMVERYGHYVLYDPPLTAHTALLWAWPALLLAAGGAIAWRRLAGHRSGKPS